MALRYFFTRLHYKVFKKNAIKHCKFMKTSRLCYHIQIVNSSMGRYSYIGEESVVINTNIGNFSSIADRCVIGGPAHAIDFVSTSPIFTSGRNIFGVNISHHKNNEYRPTEIGNDVWIGSGSLIKGGIKVGDGAVIGMGSVVTKDIPPYEIWAGNPARMIRKRFDEETIKQLLNSEWWNYSLEKLKIASKYFNDPQSFVEWVLNNKMKGGER